MSKSIERDAGSILSKLANDYFGGDRTVATWVLWRYAPDILTDKDVSKYEDLQKMYKSFQDISEQRASKWAYRADVQDAVKYLLKRMEVKKEVDLMEAFYTKAMVKGDTKALDGYLKIKDALFKNAPEGKNVLQEAIKQASVKVDKESVSKIRMEFGDDVE